MAEPRDGRSAARRGTAPAEFRDGRGRRVRRPDAKRRSGDASPSWTTRRRGIPPASGTRRTGTRGCATSRGPPPTPSRTRSPTSASTSGTSHMTRELLDPLTGIGCRCAAVPGAHRRAAARRVSRERGRRVRLRAAGRGEPARDRRPRRFADPVRDDPRRTRRRVHGRHLRRAHRQGGRLPRDARSRRAQPDPRGRERPARLPPARRDHGPGGAPPALQGVAPGRRPRLAVSTGDEVGRHDHAPRRRARDGPQGVQAGPDRAAGRDVHRAARRRRRADHRRRAAEGQRAARPVAVGGPGASRGRRRSREAQHPVVLAGAGVARDQAVGRSPALLGAAEDPGRHHVPGQGRDPRRSPERARERSGSW